MPKVKLTELVEAGAHFGHLTSRWNPKMKQYIFMEKNGIHIIDLKKTLTQIDNATKKLYEIVASGKGVLFVGTKKQAKNAISNEAKRANINWVSERWLGGMLTNFQTIKKSVKKMQSIEKMETDGTFEKMTKKEVLQLSRERDKLKKVLEGVESMAKLPGALFLVDIKKEFIAVQEAHRLNIPTFAIVDTNCDPDDVDYVIPANDDAAKAIELITKEIADIIIEGSEKAKELKAEKAAEDELERKTEEENSPRLVRKSTRKVVFDGRGQNKKVVKHDEIAEVEQESTTETLSETNNAATESENENN